jgi:chromosome segregation ATPase
MTTTLRPCSRFFLADQVEVERTGLEASAQLEQARDAFRAAQLRATDASNALRMELIKMTEERDFLRDSLEQTRMELRQSLADLVSAKDEQREQLAMFNIAAETAAKEAAEEARNLELRLNVQAATVASLQKTEAQLNSVIAQLEAELQKCRGQASELEQVCHLGLC